jgi:hypothetical protein
MDTKSSKCLRTLGAETIPSSAIISWRIPYTENGCSPSFWDSLSIRELAGTCLLPGASSTSASVPLEGDRPLPSSSSPDSTEPYSPRSLVFNSPNVETSLSSDGVPLAKSKMDANGTSSRSTLRVGGRLYFVKTGWEAAGVPVPLKTAAASSASNSYNV